MRWSALWSPALVVLIAVFATIGMLWPLAIAAGTGVQDLGDPLLQLWTLKWDLHQLARDPLHLYDANIFTPFPKPLAYSESMLATALLFAPVVWLTGNDVLAYNLLVLFSFAATVVTTFLLARLMTRHTLAALLAGLAFAFVPYRFGHLSHLNLLSLQWLPLLLLCLLSYLRTARPVWAAGFAVAFLAQALSSFYYAYLAAIACAVVLVLQPPWRDGRPVRSRLVGLGAAALAIAVVMVPVSLPYFQVNEAFDFERTLKEVDKLAATPRSYLSVAPKSWLYGDLLPRGYPNPLFPGTVVACLALVGLAVQRRRLTLIWAVLALTGVLLSFGISLNVKGTEVPMPYALLYDYLPGAKGLRDVARFGVLALLGLALLAAAGLGRLIDWIAGAGECRWRAVAAHALAVLACGAVLLEFASGFVSTVTVARDPETLAAYRWLAEQPPGVVMEFPADVIRSNDVTRATQYMYYSTFHWQPLVLGYSGYVPPLHYQIAASFPEDRRQRLPSHLHRANVGILRDLDVRYVLFHRYRYSGDDWRTVQAQLATVEGLTLVGAFGDTWVYTLEPLPRLETRRELLLPNRVLAGETFLAHYAVQNPRDETAAIAIGARARLSVDWLNAAGDVVSRTSISFEPGLLLNNGTRLIPLELGLVPAPGDYQVRVTSDDTRVQPLLPDSPVPVTVEAAPGPDALAGPPPRLASVRWPDRVYHPGEVIPVALTWEAQGPLPGQVVFFQLIGPDNKVWGQRDGQPLDGRRPASAWLPGERIEDRRDLPIQDDAAPGAYRILVGLYQPETGERLPILGPAGGPAATEIWSAPLEIAARP